MASDAQVRASARYNARNTVQVPLRLNVNTDADIIRRLEEQPSKAGYIKALIREDIRRRAASGS